MTLAQWRAFSRAQRVSNCICQAIMHCLSSNVPHESWKIHSVSTRFIECQKKTNFRDPEGIYFTTSTVVHWIDLFTRKELKHIVVNSIKHCQEKKGLLVYAWVLMPSHLHMIVSSKEIPLSVIMRDLKKHTTRKIIKEIININESRKDWLLRAFVNAGKDLQRITKNKVWKDGNHPIELDNNQLQQEKLDYIHQNPVEAEIVDEPDYYWYSSARDYSGLSGLIKVELIN